MILSNSLAFREIPVKFRENCAEKWALLGKNSRHMRKKFKIISRILMHFDEILKIGAKVCGISQIQQHIYVD